MFGPVRFPSSGATEQALKFAALFSIQNPKPAQGRSRELPKVELLGNSEDFRQAVLGRFTVRSTGAEEHVSEDDRGDYGDPGSLRFDGKLSRRGRVGGMLASHRRPLCAGP